MKQTVLALFFLLALLVWSPLNVVAAESEVKFKAGDIIFQELAGGQNLAVRLVTGSRYTHCGIIMDKQGELAVYEAIGPVDWKPLDDWIKARGGRPLCSDASKRRQRFDDGCAGGHAAKRR